MNASLAHQQEECINAGKAYELGRHSFANDRTYEVSGDCVTPIAAAFERGYADAEADAATFNEWAERFWDRRFSTLFRSPEEWVRFSLRRMMAHVQHVQS